MICPNCETPITEHTEEGNQLTGCELSRTILLAVCDVRFHEVTR